jgi:GAF domain-containing protein
MSAWLRSRPQADGPAPMADATVDALSAVVEALGQARSAAEVGFRALDVVRRSFGWAYASYWQIDRQRNVLRFLIESGTAGEEFRRVTAEAEFARGVGLAGRAWDSGRLVFAPDLGLVTDCVRAPAARRAGVRSGVCLPIVQDGSVVATMDFFTTATLELSAERRQALALVAALISQALERLARAERAQAAADAADAVTTVLAALGSSTDEDVTLRAVLDAVRDAFGWAYGSVWKVDPHTGTLRFAVDSGQVDEEFQRATLEASFARGVGLSGRTWASGELQFVADLAEVTDCVRAPAARRAGVKSGVCLPIRVGQHTVATMDFFALEAVQLPAERLDALRTVAEMCGRTLDRLRGNAERNSVAGQLMASVTQLAASAGRSATMANEAVGMARQVAERLTALRASSEAIGHIVAVIDTIADQTNLLALNATIEAARAGDAGRGFAVVANEVKQLAGETATATGDVSKRISSIQLDTGAVAEAITEIESVIRRMDQIQQEISAGLSEQSGIARQLVV